MALITGLGIVTQSCDRDEKDPPYTPEPPIVNPENVRFGLNSTALGNNGIDATRDSIRVLKLNPAVLDIEFYPNEIWDITSNALVTSARNFHELWVASDRIHGTDTIWTRPAHITGTTSNLVIAREQLREAGFEFGDMHEKRARLTTTQTQKIR